MFAAIFSYLTALLLFTNAAATASAQPLLYGVNLVVAVWFTVMGSVAGWQHFRE